jgi:hypothetical protein
LRVLVDTNVWSLALRRSQARASESDMKLTAILGDLIREDRARLIGPIRQELLSGIREPLHFARLKNYLRAFADEVVKTEDFDRAAQFDNQCRSRGISGSGTDFLICSVASARGWQICTNDGDFVHYAKVLPVRLFLR